MPQPIPIVSEDTAAHGIEKVIFKKLTHKGENKKAQLTATLELWEFIPQTITATTAGSAGNSGQTGGGGSGGSQTQSSLSSEYKNYLSKDRGKSPAIDDADSSKGMNAVSQMPY